MVADQPGFDIAVLAAREQGAHEAVVVAGLVDEAPSVARHRDQARLAALDEVRERLGAAVCKRHQRHRRPGTVVGQCAIDLRARGLAHAQAVAAVGQRRGRPMLAAARRMREQRRLARIVVREAAAGQHDAAAGADLALLASLTMGQAHARAGDAAALAQKPDYGVRLVQLDALVERRLEQRCGQRVATHAHGTAAVAQYVPGLAQHALGDVDERIGRAAGAQEVAKVAADADADETTTDRKAVAGARGAIRVAVRRTARRTAIGHLRERSARGRGSRAPHCHRRTPARCGRGGTARRPAHAPETPRCARRGTARRKWLAGSAAARRCLRRCRRRAPAGCAE